jgi:hypothetical protein
VTLTDADFVRLQAALDAAAEFVVAAGSASGGWEAGWPARRRPIPRRTIEQWLGHGMYPGHVVVAACGAEIVGDDVDLYASDEPADARPARRPRRASSLPPSSRPGG